MGLFTNIRVMYFPLSENASRNRRFVPIIAVSFLPSGQYAVDYVYRGSGSVDK